MGSGDPAGGAEEAALGLAFLSQSGCHSVLRFLEREGPDVVWRASRRRLLEWGLIPRAVDSFEEKRRCFAVEEMRALLERSGLRFIPYGSSLYPAELAQLRCPPAGLFARGSEDAIVRLLGLPRVTIVGTRRATPYGLRVTEMFAYAFAAAGIVVVSGLALGIDGRAHEAALDAGGLTAAVLGCGADVIYPRRHQSLYGRLAARGLILSELPPGTAPSRWTFPHRNRLLAALGDAVLVSEGSLTSGALQTADWALELGRPVYAVPGPIAVDGYRGCNTLLYQGAVPAVEPFVAVEDFFTQTRIERAVRPSAERLGAGGDGRRGSATGSRNPRPGASEVPARVSGSADWSCGFAGHCAEGILEALGEGASSVDSLVAHTGLATRQIIATLAEMELKGAVTRSGPGLYIRAP